MSLKRLYRHMNREIEQIDRYLATRVRTDHPTIEAASRQLLDAVENGFALHSSY